MDTARRQQVLGLKLRALVRDGFGVEDGEPGPFKDGATWRAGDRGWVLFETDQSGALGGALAWAAKHELNELHLLAEEAAGALSRRAAAFGSPASISVHGIDGRSLVAVEADSPVSPPTDIDPTWADALRGAGTDPVLEIEGLRGEVRGLSVARFRADGRLDVGVSVNDREAHDELNDGNPSIAVVADVAVTVASRRRADGDHHPWRAMEVDRWLRAALCRRPALVGLDGRELVAWWWPASAATPEGDVLVVCGSGTDLDLVPAAADARRSFIAAGGSSDVKLVVAVAAESDHPVVARVVAMLSDPAELRIVDGDWRAAAG